MIFPISITEPLVTITPWSLESIGGTLLNGAASSLNSLGSSVYNTANRIYYFPFFISKPIIVRNLFCLNGSAVSGNIDIGIYDSTGNKIVSTGSTAQSGTSAIQAVSITPTQLAPGVYYMAIVMDNTTGTLYRTNSLLFVAIQSAGVAMQASTFPLPATATFVSMATSYVPLFGLSTRGVV